MKLFIINGTTITEYYFNKLDERAIIERCKTAGKQWSDKLVGFFINTTNNINYAAINIKGDDGVIESMEYVDIERDYPEFSISSDFLNFLSTQASNTEIPLTAFEPVLAEILIAPVKARRWEVYQEINNHYLLTH